MSPATLGQRPVTLGRAPATLGQRPVTLGRAPCNTGEAFYSNTLRFKVASACESLSGTKFHVIRIQSKKLVIIFLNCDSADTASSKQVAGARSTCTRSDDYSSSKTSSAATSKFSPPFHMASLHVITLKFLCRMRAGYFFDVNFVVSTCITNLLS